MPLGEGVGANASADGFLSGSIGAEGEASPLKYLFFH